MSRQPTVAPPRLPPAQDLAIHVLGNGTRQSDEFLKGVISHVQRHRLNWHLTHAIPQILEQLLLSAEPSLGGLRRPVAVIGFLTDPQLLRVLRSVRLPVVTCSMGTPDLPGLARVLPDDQGIGQMAARFLLAQGFRHFALWGRPLPGRTARFDAFRRTLAAAGTATTCRSFIPAADRKLDEDFLSFTGISPGPLAVFCHQDHDAAFVREFCFNLGLGVPGQVAILGVDDDPGICLRSEPFLSSVALPWNSLGRRAAEILHARLSGAEVASLTQLPPLRVVARASTGRVPSPDRLVEKIRRLIDQHPGRQWTLAAMAATVGNSPRTVQRRLHAAGMDLRRQLLNRRIDAAEELLAANHHTIDQVRERCGFNSRQAFYQAFKARHGCGPADWRSRSVG
ncbi:XylR family transcriptional regulator [Planctomycetota bacterium]|nr:XylR family transcriptional regulator [Planctomycetota bacterium]